MRAKRLEKPSTEIERQARSFIETVPEQGDYTREDYIITGAAMIKTELRQLVNDHALEEPKSGYEQGLAEGLIWAWERVAQLFLKEDEELERLLGKRNF